jgi:SAM-dependent methyltransferase
MTVGSPTVGAAVDTVAFYDRTASEYDHQVDGLAYNRTTRDAFRTRVSELAGPAATILDFGCGTGTDAAWYASRGHRVIAYDVSAGMVDVLRSRCSDAIANSRILPVVGSMDDLGAALRSMGQVDAVAANFAVLNHFAQLEPAFAFIASHLRPDGVLVASLLNPLYRTDMRRRWWLKRVWLTLWADTVTVPGVVTTYRHHLRAVRRMAERTFTLEETAHADDESGWCTTRLGWRDLLRREFRFVVLRKCA